MKKYIFILICLLLLTTFLIFIKYPKKDEQEKYQYDFYKKELEERYKEYKQEHPFLDEIDIITRVNLNLDKDFYTNTKPSKYLNTSKVLVNKYNYLDNNYIPDNLEKITDCVNGIKYLVSDANNDFKKLCTDITKENLNLRVISSYRGYNYQKTLYDNYVLKDGKEIADTYSARPGFSEHQTGLTIDVDNGNIDYNNFENTPEFTWMINNSYKYGFILRYPYGKEDITGFEYESWHYRYVGKEIADYIYNHDITFDEYYVRFIEK